MEENKCNCNETCTCGCQEGKPCTCEDEMCTCGCEEEKCTCDECTCDECTVNTSNIKMEDVLAGTKYIEPEEVRKNGKLNSIFDDINSLSKFSSNSKALFE